MARDAVVHEKIVPARIPGMTAGAVFRADQRVLDAVCRAKMIVSTSLLRNNTRPLGVR
jgi:hypothetical protein